MTAMLEWIRLPLAQGLGWALVHFVWQGALIALLLAAVLPACRGSRARYGAACVALLAMLSAFVWTWAKSIPDPAAAVSLTIGGAAQPGAAPAMAEQAPGLLERAQQALPWVVPVWMAGALLVGLYRLSGWITLQRVRRTGVCAASAEWRRKVSLLSRSIGVSDPIVLLESSLAQTPMVVGLLRPAILMPVGLLSGLPASQVEAILLHELAHIRRLDYLFNLVQSFVETLLFYHPAVWWVSSLMRNERENCCDDAVVRVQGNAREYAAALVTLEERRGVGLEPAPAATGGKLMNRIRRLLTAAEEPRAAAGPIFSMGLLLTVFCALAIAQQAGSTDEASPETAHEKWLLNDVVYIIEDEERAAFERLQTDEERDRFIEQFWARRDPTPGTAENEFKEEHYRRIAYANDRFAAESPGWKSDRGRLYVVYGPPDEIEAHPNGGTFRRPNAEPLSSSNPFVIWRYRRMEGVGHDILMTFVDTDRSGEYRLVNWPAGLGPEKAR